MITDKLLVDEFNFIGVDDLDDNIIIKCLDIATRYKIDAERFVEEWIAFAQTNLNGVFKPTTVTLDTMERKQLIKNQVKSGIVKKETNEQQSSEAASAVKIYNSNNGNATDVSNILNAYNAGTPKKSQQAIIKQNGTTLSPSTYNPEVAKPSTVYAQRKDHGQILETFGSSENLAKDAKPQPKCPDVKITFLGKESWDSPIHSRYMYETPAIEVTESNKRIDYYGELLKNKYYPKTEESNNDQRLVYGRIVTDGDRINAKSILFETTGTSGLAEVLTLDLSHIPRYAIFPGKVLLLDVKEQTNDKKSVLVANKLHCDVSPDLPEQLPGFPPNSGPLKLVIASGPFTLSDNLTYQPLLDLIKYVISNPPDVLILIGPFVDKTHGSVVDGTIADSFDEYFEKLLDKVTTPLENTDVQIVVVSSALDAHYHSIYPTPPFEAPSNLNNQNIHMVSDPAMIDINGVVIGVSSVDALFHLAKSEFICQPENTDRMSRFAEHVISQRCFYPLYPAQSSGPGCAPVPVDVQLLNVHGVFDVRPHIMVLPSNLKKFVKNINGCVVINPERLSKGYVGGTFACVNIHPIETPQQQQQQQQQKSLADNITCKIIKI